MTGGGVMVPPPAALEKENVGVPITKSVKILLNPNHTTNRIVVVANTRPFMGSSRMMFLIKPNNMMNVMLPTNNCACSKLRIYKLSC